MNDNENRLDVTNSKYIVRAKENREHQETFSRIDSLAHEFKVKRIVLGKKKYNDIVDFFPTELKVKLGDGFLYKDVLIQWV